MLLPDRSRHARPYYWVIAALIIIIGIAASAYVYVQVDRSSRADIIERAATLAEAIPPDQVQALKGNAGDLALPQYQLLKALMMREHAANPGIRFVYLIGAEPDGTLFFYADSEDPASPDYSPPGQEYPEASPAMHVFFSDGGKSLAEGPDRDRWGLWISAYAPVRDADGKLIAMLGMDVPAESYLINLIAEASLPLLLAALILILLLVDAIRRGRREMLLTQKAEFLSIASHQIRTPLIGIRWAVEQVLASKDSHMSDRDRDVLSLTDESSLGLIARVNNLLDVTALEQDGHPIATNQSTLIRPFLEDIAGSLALSAKRKRIRIVIDESVPGDLSVAGNRENMQHIFFNLLGNAVKYTNEGTDVTVSYEWTLNGHQFTIKDHGIGIAPEDQDLIFAGYHRTQQARESGESGSGLGLYLTKRLVELLKGTIDVRSKVGEGSAFTVTLPS
ncbi:MAG: Two-component system, cell cycle sensor histidine kinase PleC [Parcubacteria group bacterium]|nr:Two-component system, cell cycle sensor histidine kinase PleC [Parcubacteria group bacterium]